MDDDFMYTEEVKRHIYEIKARLPADFPLVTEVREVYIIIIVQMKDFAWRTVEDRLDIAVELEKLRGLIEGAGVPCLIEKA